jgi:hypothetical protein
VDGIAATASRNNRHLWVWVPARAALGRDDENVCSFQFSNNPEDMRPHSRGSNRPRFDRTLSPLKTEGAGKTGCALHPRSRVQNAHKKTHTSIQVQRRQSGLPCAMVLRLMSCSPRRRIRSCHRHRRIKGLVAPGRARKTSADLTPATGARTTRFCRPHIRRSSACRSIAHGKPALRSPLRAGAVASTASRSAFVTIASRPSGNETVGM